jgi:hypothetical protein
MAIIIFKIRATVRNLVAHNLCTASEIHALLLKVVVFAPRSLIDTEHAATIFRTEKVGVKVSVERCPITPHQRTSYLSRPLQPQEPQTARTVLV